MGCWVTTVALLLLLLLLLFVYKLFHRLNTTVKLSFLHEQ
jgi:hypothetical protein